MDEFPLLVFPLLVLPKVSTFSLISIARDTGLQCLRRGDRVRFSYISDTLYTFSVYTFIS